MSADRGPSPRDLSIMLADEIEAVVRDLGLSVKYRDRRRLYCFAPWGDGRKPKLEVEVMPIAGKWNDWQAGKYGDALGLVGCVLTGQDDQRTHAARLEGIRWARERYGLGGDSFDREAFAKRKAEAAERAKEAAKVAADQLKKNRGIAQHLWINAEALRPTSRTQPGCHGARYLEARGIDFAQLGRLPRAVRYSPRETWFGKGGEQHFGPALVSAMTLVDGTFASVHRIWIDPANPGEKADLDPPRKMWPESEGAAIRLWRGAGALDEATAKATGKRGPLVVCEGVEDGLSIAMMTPELRVHAAGSLPGLWSYQPPECASEIIVAADNDWDRPQAMALLKRSIERLSAIVPVRVARSPEGKDFNDLLRGE
jgi:hypothetical protein